MSSGNLMAQIHKGMEVETADGRPLGKIAHVWLGADPGDSNQRCDEEVCSRLEVHLSHRGGARFIPYNVIREISGKRVTLSIDEATVNDKLWHQRPQWLPSEESFEVFDHSIRPHP